MRKHQEKDLNILKKIWFPDGSEQGAYKSHIGIKCQASKEECPVSVVVV